MATRKRPSSHKREREFKKRQRELKKAEKAALKRERRSKCAGPGPEATSAEDIRDESAGPNGPAA